jgi:hypothetical protein
MLIIFESGQSKMPGHGGRVSRHLRRDIYLLEGLGRHGGR